MEKVRIVNVDEMLSLVGEYGPFQWTVNALFCFMMAPRIYQILLMYFAALSPPWRCVANSSICLLNGTMKSTNTYRCDMPRDEWEYTEPIEYSIVTQFDINCDNEWQIHLTTSILFIGWAVGAVVTAWLADSYGRKKVFFPCLMTTFIVGLISAFTPNIYTFLICRFIVGFCAPGAGVQMFILMSEIVGNKYRPMAGNLLWIFFTVGLCTLGIKAYFIRTWKMLIIACTAPYLFLIIFYKLIPESVRWLHLRGKTEEAVQLFKKIAKRNNKEYPTDVKLSSVDEEHRQKTSMKDLFKTLTSTISNIVQGYTWFANALLYYGISLAADDLGGSLYVNYILISAMEFPAAILAIYLCGKLGRKKTVMISMLICSITCICIGFIPAESSAKIGKVILAMFVKLCISISFDSLFTWSAEIYPTMQRANGMGFLQITSRIGAAGAPWIAKGSKSIHQVLPFIVMGSVTLIGACAVMVLPETKNTVGESSRTVQPNGKEEKYAADNKDFQSEEAV